MKQDAANPHKPNPPASSPEAADGAAGKLQSGHCGTRRELGTGLCQLLELGELRARSLARRFSGRFGAGFLGSRAGAGAPRALDVRTAPGQAPEDLLAVFSIGNHKSCSRSAQDQALFLSLALTGRA